MRKHTHVHRPRVSAMRSSLPQKRSRHRIRWIVITALCVAIFFCLVVLINAAWAGNGSTTRMQNPQPMVQPAPMRHAGIVNMQQGPFLSSVFTVRNFWQGPVGHDWVLAYAGAKPNADGTTGQGGIVLYTETVNQFGGFDLHPLGTFLAASGCPALTITSIQGNLMKVRPAIGHQLTFNLQTHQFQ